MRILKLSHVLGSTAGLVILSGVVFSGCTTARTTERIVKPIMKPIVETHVDESQEKLKIIARTLEKAFDFGKMLINQNDILLEKLVEQHESGRAREAKAATEGLLLAKQWVTSALMARRGSTVNDLVVFFARILKDADYSVSVSKKSPQSPARPASF